MSVVSKTAETNTVTTYFVSALAGPRLNRRRVEKGDEVEMTEHQARALLLSGDLVDDEAKVDDPFGAVARAAEAKAAADKEAADAKAAADKAAADAKAVADRAAADKVAADARAAALKAARPADAPTPNALS